MPRGFLILLGLLVSSAANAQMVIPRAMAQGNSGFVREALGQTCYAFDMGADNLPCNPAYIAREREHQFKASLFFGNNIRYQKEAQDLLNGNADQQTVQTLFSQHESSSLETSAEAAYVGETFGLAVEPFRLNYFTLFRNQALPEVSLFVSQEETLRTQFGSYIANDFYWGVQVGYLHRKFIAQDFFLTDYLAQDGDQLFQTQQQNLLFIEPSFLYANDDHWMRPQMSVSLANWGMVDHKVDAYRSDPQFHWSGSVNPDWGPGRFGFGFDAFWDNQIDTVLEPFSIGSYYQFGILKVFGSLAPKTNGAGFQVNVEQVNLGLTYSSQEIENGLGDQMTDRRVYMLLGVEI